jgi:protein-glutamine gamma-glutamyltransferase
MPAFVPWPSSPMRLSERQFNLLGATALMAVATHLSRLPLWLTAFLLLLAPWRMWSRARSDKPISAWFRVPMVFALVAAIVVHYGNLFGREPGSALACGLLMLKLLESEKIRDARAAIGFAAFVLMSALLFTQTMGFTLMLCLSLVFLLAALTALQPAPVRSRNPILGELRTGATLLGLGLPLAIAAFLFVPRLSSPLWGAPGGFADARTGLSDSMSPGSMTDLLVDDSPALRIHFDGAVPENAARYFRALVLWDFDGTTWNRDDQRPQQTLESVESLGEEISYEVTLEPTNRPWLAALDVPLQTPERARMTNDRSLFARNSIDQIRQYRVRSALDYRLSASISPRDRRRALRLPPGFNPRTLALAQEWRAEGKADSAIVKSALDLFSASFTYTLSPPLLGRNSVDDFLFETQAGFCEHYSSAFVVLMRAAGIPARVVTGYQGGWWNALGDYLLVRQSDAHAWSEIWLQERGWVRVDPTAAVNPVRVEAGAAAANSEQNWSVKSWWLGMRNQLDVINRMWAQTIVQFNALRQQNLLTPFGITRAEQKDLLLALVCVVGSFLVLATFWVLRTVKVRKGDTLDAAWRMLRQRMVNRGLPVAEHEGPLDYLNRIRSSIEDGPARQQLDELVRRYIELRYASAAPEQSDVQGLARRIREFKPPVVVQGMRIPAG